MTNTELANASKVILGTTEASAVYIGDTLVWLVLTSRLPAGYTELEYISSTSSGGQYINLDIKLYAVKGTNYDIAIKFNIKGPGKDNTLPTLFGCLNQTNPWPGTFIRMYALGSSNDVTGRYIGGTAKDNTIGRINNIIELPVLTPPNKNVTNINNNNSTHQFGTSLFCAFQTSTNTAFRFVEADVYYFKLFVGGSLVRDMVPCKNSSNVVGLYDLVNNVFYTSPNGAAFVAGPVLLSYDAEIEYLLSSGTQYINTNIIPTANTNVAIEFETNYLSGDNAYSIFGCRVSSGLQSFLLLQYKNNGYQRWRWDYGNSLTNMPSVQSGMTTGLSNGNSFTMYNNTTSGGTFLTTTLPIYLFSCNQNGSLFGTHINLKIKSLKIYENNTLIMDLIPVRVGLTGYMYDRVSNLLFGNDGTGSFILGSDKQ